MIYKVIDKDSYHRDCECRINRILLKAEYLAKYPDHADSPWTKVNVTFTYHSDNCSKRSERGSNFYRRQIVDKISMWLYND